METAAATAVQGASRGRPREFCVDEALAAALRVFWRKGYEGASLTDLTNEMGITRPSLYAAFGNKETLFRKALDLYEKEKLAYVGAALEAPTARGVAERLMRGSVEMQTSSCDPKGCMGVIATLACGDEAKSIREEVIRRRDSSDRALLARFERAKAEGDLPPATDVPALTKFLYALLNGMAVQASAGASRADLEQVVETSLAMWPSS